jgi:hypothetical protein
MPLLYNVRSLTSSIRLVCLVRPLIVRRILPHAWVSLDYTLQVVFYRYVLYLITLYFIIVRRTSYICFLVIFLFAPETAVYASSLLAALNMHPYPVYDHCAPFECFRTFNRYDVTQFPL